MGLLKILAIGSAAAAVFFGIFNQYAKMEMQNFAIDFSQTPNKVVVVTGGNSGLGYYTALRLAKEKAKVILACRSQEKCEVARKSLLNEVPQAAVECMKLDLASFDSVRQFAKEFISRHHHVDILINNAGVMALPKREVTEDGLEFQIGTNHFGHFLLTALLYPHISQGGRIINHSSGAHVLAATNFVFKDMNQEKAYDPWVAYGNSKLANLLFTFELHRRLAHIGNPKKIKVIAVHPGYTATNLQNSRYPFWEQINAIFAMHGSEGALSQIYAAVDPNAQDSVNDYIGPIYSIFGKPTVMSTSKAATDAQAQSKLWKESERLTGEKFLSA